MVISGPMNGLDGHANGSVASSSAMGNSAPDPITVSTRSTTMPSSTASWSMASRMRAGTAPSGAMTSTPRPPVVSVPTASSSISSIASSHRPDRFEPRATSAGAAPVFFPGPSPDSGVVVASDVAPGVAVVDVVDVSVEVSSDAPGRASPVGRVDRRLSDGHAHRLAAFCGESTTSFHATTKSTRPCGNNEPASVCSSAAVTRAGNPAAVN